VNERQAEKIQNVRDLVERAAEQSDAVRDATEDIVTATERQDVAIDGLVNRVNDLRNEKS
jgi:NAD-dependent DNA ligase